MPDFNLLSGILPDSFFAVKCCLLYAYIVSVLLPCLLSGLLPFLCAFLGYEHFISFSVMPCLYCAYVDCYIIINFGIVIAYSYISSNKQNT